MVLLIENRKPQMMLYESFPGFCLFYFICSINYAKIKMQNICADQESAEEILWFKVELANTLEEETNNTACFTICNGVYNSRVKSGETCQSAINPS